MKVPFLASFCLVPLALIVLCINVAIVSAHCQGDQQSLLLRLKESLGFNPSKFSKLVTWDSSSDCCDWQGVSCDPAGLGHVVGLDLSNESISGRFPSDIFDLQYLQRLNLCFNNFNITIPDRLANLTELVYLNLSNAGFSGQIPLQLSQMQKLVTLDLSVSSLYAMKGKSLILENPNLASLVRNLSSLRELHLDGIRVSRDGKDWCQALSTSLPNLQVLSLANCNLSSPIDASLKNLTLLSIIKLDGNNFSGLETEIFASFSNLTALHLSSCGLNGSFPGAILQIPSLETLDLSNNKNLSVSFPRFHQNQSLRNLLLSGTLLQRGLPHYIDQLKNLSRVELAQCNVTGTIPNSMANLTQLVSLDLSFNKLTGSIPSFNKLRNLTYLDLSQNELSGEVPSSYFQGVRNLNKIDLSYNSFSGSIPRSLFEIPTMEQIRLSSNQFEGQIPEFPYASASFINLLDLSSNNLDGPIPSFIFKLSRLNVLSLSFNKLNGSIQLDWVRNLSNLTSLDLSHNSLTVEVPSSESNIPSFPQITTLRLASCNLTKFPELGNQSKLYYLDLSMNNIPKMLPWLEKFANGSLLYLNLSYNLLQGLPELTSFSQLAILDVHDNQLYGEVPFTPPSATYVDFSDNNFNSVIPPEIGKTIPFAYFFSLANNSLSGVISESICNASYLQVLDLSDNLLSGEIPTCLTERIENLGVLNLRRNHLNGTIPDNFQGKCALQTLDLSNNTLHGKVPKTLANCIKLEVLDLGNNQINDEFPCALKGHVPNLRVLILRNNLFHGQVGCPDIQVSWEKLQIVDLAYNQFNGSLPGKALYTWKAMKEDGNEIHDRIKYEALGLTRLYYEDSVTVTSKGFQVDLVRILTIFTSIDFSCNKLEGQLPEAIGQFRALRLLNLSHNSFSGPILSSMGNLSQLESLDLSVNNFGGPIPPQLANLSFLSFLNLSDNKLTGRIPSGTQLQSFSESSFEDNPGLCGSPLASCLLRPATPPLSTPEKQSRLDWQFILAGMGFGMGSAAVVAPLLFHKDVNRWCDDRVDDILIVLLPMFGFVYYTKGDWRIEPDESPDGDEDEEDDTYGGDFTGEGTYCIFCTKLDTAMERVVHDPNCTCHCSPPISSSTSTFSSSASP